MLKLNIQLFADGKIVIDTQLNSKNFENGLNRLQGATKKAGSTIKSIVAGLGITKLISTGINMINNSLDTAITRFDTLKNFPKVMSNLGISASKSQKSIDKLADKLQGLPTTLQDGAMAVQRFTSANSDIEKSTDMFLALNNAILAGGASSEIQASALEQLSQSYAKGKPDMMEWRTAMTAMPAQLKQVAKAMGYVNADALGEALRKGDVSMEKFMDTVIKLNKEGVEGFQSFEQQARNSTDGIRTSLTVLKGRVAQGVTAIIDSVDKKLKSSNLGGISDLIINFADKMKGGLKGVAEVIEGDTKQMILNWLKNFETAGPQMIESFTNSITEKLPDVINTAGEVLGQFISTINANIPAIYSSGVSLITTFVNSVAEQLPNLIPKLVDTLINLFMAINDPKNLDKIGEAGANLILKLIEGMVKALPKLIENTDFTLQSFLNILSGGKLLIAKIGFSLMKALIKGILESASDLLSKGKQVVDKFIKGLKLGLKAIGAVGKSLIDGFWKGIQDRWNGLKGKVEGFGKGIVKKFKDVFGIKSPSKVMRDQVGKFLPLGMFEGFEDELGGVYNKMQKAINFENAKLQANVETGKVFNTLANTTPVFVEVNADVEMDKTKVGRIITPVVSETLKIGGLR